MPIWSTAGKGFAIASISTTWFTPSIWPCKPPVWMARLCSWADHEQMTWAYFYRPIAEALGYDSTQLAEAAIPEFTPGWRERVKTLHGAKPVQGFLAPSRQSWRQAAFDGLSTLLAKPSSPWTVPTATQPVASQEMALLYRCRYRLPFAKAHTKLGYEPVVSVAEGCCRTVDWALVCWLSGGVMGDGTSVFWVSQ